MVNKMILSICETPEALKVFKIVKLVIDLIKIIIPILLIISLMLEYSKAITSNDNDLLSKANKNAVRKGIAALLVFLIPTAISIISFASGFNEDSYISCLNNATDENIVELQKEITLEYIDNLKDNYSEGEYLRIQTYIYTIKDDDVKNNLLEKLKAAYKKPETNNNTTNPTPVVGKRCSNGTDISASSKPIVNKYVEEAYKLANDDTHGYHSEVNYNLLNPDVDCGTFVSFSLVHSGLIKSGTFVHANPDHAKKTLEPYGFKMYAFNKSELEYGDILVRSGHIEIYVGNSKSIGAHTTYGHPEEGDQDGCEVSVVNMSSNWSNYLRYEN